MAAITQTQITISPEGALQYGYVVERTITIAGPGDKLNTANIKKILEAFAEYRIAQLNNVNAERQLSNEGIDATLNPNNPYTIIAVNAADRAKAALKSLSEAYSTTGLKLY